MPDLPQGLFQTNSDWINVGFNTAELIVPEHTSSFGGRSVFTVWFHDAKGRRAGLDYLEQLRAFKPMWVPAPNVPFANTNFILLNSNLPEFPAQSQWALVRRMCVIDVDGRIQPTHLVESIQLRTYLDVANPNGDSAQQFNEFDMSRRSHADLVSIPKDRRDFTNIRLRSFGIDFWSPVSKCQRVMILRRAKGLFLITVSPVIMAPASVPLTVLPAFLPVNTLRQRN